MSGLVTFGSGGVAAPRKAMLIGIPPMSSTRRWIPPSVRLWTAVLLICLSPRAGSDYKCPPLVIVVGLTMSMLGGCNV